MFIMFNIFVWYVVYKMFDKYLYVLRSWCVYVFKKVFKWRSDLFCLEKKVFLLSCNLRLFFFKDIYYIRNICISSNNFFFKSWVILDK